MDTDQKQSFAELEDTEDFARTLAHLARQASQKAILEAHQKGVSVTYLEAKNIVQVDANGDKTIIGQVKDTFRQVKVGNRAKI